MSSNRVVRRAVLLTFLYLFAAAGFAQKARSIYGGITRVTLDDSFASALSGLGVKLGTVAPSEADGHRVFFPITSGAIDLDTLKGNLLHSGGITLTAGTTKVTLQSFIIDTTGQVVSGPVITGLVVKDGTVVGRLPLFDLAVSASDISTPDWWLVIKDVKVTLDATGASALNAAFGLTGASALTSSVAVGTARVDARL